MSIIGTNIWAELQAAGVTCVEQVLHDAGTMTYKPGATAQQMAAAQAVLAGHTPTPVMVANVKGFKSWLKANMTFTLRNNVAKVYPNFMGDLNNQEWDDFQAGCEVAKAAVPLTAGQWTAFKNACTTYSIPVTLN